MTNRGSVRDPLSVPPDIVSGVPLALRWRIRHLIDVRDISATDAARRFSEVLDAVEPVVRALSWCDAVVPSRGSSVADGQRPRTEGPPPR
jgi:hypothetical protein